MWGQVYEHLVLPFQQSRGPAWEVARGAAIGMFVGITPTMGVQMYVVALIWLVMRYVFRFRFNLPIGVAMVWISNPVTFIPMYYGYLIVGQWVLGWWEGGSVVTTYEHFQNTMMALSEARDASFLEKVLTGLSVIVIEFGWPMVIGSIVFAVPITIVTYPVTNVVMVKYRQKVAEQLGMSYEEWKQKYVRLD